MVVPAAAGLARLRDAAPFQHDQGVRARRRAAQGQYPVRVGHVFQRAGDHDQVVTVRFERHLLRALDGDWSLQVPDAVLDIASIRIGAVAFPSMRKEGLHHAAGRTADIEHSPGRRKQGLQVAEKMFTAADLVRDEAFARCGRAVQHHSVAAIVVLGVHGRSEARILPQVAAAVTRDHLQPGTQSLLDLHAGADHGVLRAVAHFARKLVRRVLWRHPEMAQVLL
jgi:hypothetical protein